MVGINTAKEQSNITNPFIETRLPLRFDQATERDHIVHIEIAEFAFTPLSALFKVKHSCVRANKRTQHLDQVFSNVGLAKQPRHSVRLEYRDGLALGIPVENETPAF